MGFDSHLSFGKYFLEETQHLWYVQLDVLEVQEMLIVLLLNAGTMGSVWGAK